MAHFNVAHSFYRLRVETCSPYLEQEIMPQYKREDARATRLYARGVWTLMDVSTGEEMERRLDKYPLGLGGAPLGWGHDGLLRRWKRLSFMSCLRNETWQR
jgi:hypothetical protein